MNQDQHGGQKPGHQDKPGQQQQGGGQKPGQRDDHEKPGQHGRMPARHSDHRR